jgi:hypothetical protein
VRQNCGRTLENAPRIVIFSPRWVLAAACVSPAEEKIAAAM